MTKNLYNVTKETVLAADYDVALFTHKSMLSGARREWLDQLAGDLAGYLNSAEALQETIAYGWGTDNDNFRVAFLEVYTNAQALRADDNGKAALRLKNAFDRAMRLIGSDFTVNKGSKGRYEFVLKAKRNNAKKVPAWKYSKAAEKVAKDIRKKDVDIDNLAAFLADAGIDADTLYMIASAMEDAS